MQVPLSALPHLARQVEPHSQYPRPIPLAYLDLALPYRSLWRHAVPRRRDKFSRAKRSLIMSRIRSRNTRIELAMKKALRKAGVTLKMHPRMVGNPDFLVGENILVFCDSSFWHGRNWKKLKAQLARGSNSSYWITHIARNRKRDRQVNSVLRAQGYHVMRFWDYQIAKRPAKCTERIKNVSSKL